MKYFTINFDEKVGVIISVSNGIFTKKQVTISDADVASIQALLTKYN